MEEYLALTDGCRIGVLTVSDFGYLGVRENPIFIEDVPPNFVNVTPSQPCGPSGMRLPFDGGLTLALGSTPRARGFSNTPSSFSKRSTFPRSGPTGWALV
jgi:hypothetical protein